MQAKRRRAKSYSDAEIHRAVQANAGGARVEDICRALGITPSRFYTWRAAHRNKLARQRRPVLMPMMLIRSPPKVVQCVRGAANVTPTHAPLTSVGAEIAYETSVV